MPDNSSKFAYVSGAIVVYDPISGTIKPTTGPLSIQSFGNTLYADQFAGADIFAKANTAAASLSGPGVVVIPPGKYAGVTTTLVGVTGVVFSAYGVDVAFSGTTGNAIEFKSTVSAGLLGLSMTGPGNGTGVGLYVGNSTIGQGETIYCKFRDVVIGADSRNTSIGTISGFHTGIQIDGTTGSGTYTNFFENVHVQASLSTGWYLAPTTATFANANSFLSCSSLGSVSDGFYLDGSNGNTFASCRSESNGGYGWNLQIVDSNTWVGGHCEANTSADFNFIAATNSNFIIGMDALSSTPVNGVGSNNVILLANAQNFNISQPAINSTGLFAAPKATPPAVFVGASPGDIGAARSKISGVAYLGTDSNCYIFRNSTDNLQIVAGSGTLTFNAGVLGVPAVNAESFEAGGTPGVASFSGPVTNITVKNGIITAIS